MAKRTGPTNLSTRKLIADLRSLGTKEKAPIWKRIADDLTRTTRTRREVNLLTIEKAIENDEIALVPGKVLSQGKLTKKVTVASFKVSEKAKEKINKEGKSITIQQLMKENPKGKKVRIIG